MVSHHHPEAAGAPGRTRERGVIVPIAALSMVTVLVVIGLVIDGSQAYPQRRNMQNAADAASLAGARELDKVKYSSQATATVAATVEEVAEANGADEHAVICKIITKDWDPLTIDQVWDGPVPGVLGSCDEHAGDEGAAGVVVRASHTTATYFGGFTNTEEITARASAAATIQTFVGGGVGTPFIVCGNARVGGYDYLGIDGRINLDTAEDVGRVPIQGSQIPTCNAGSAFKGKIDPDATIPALPATIAGDNGNGFDGDIQVQVLGSSACTADDIAKIQSDGVVDCDMILPIADNGWGNGQNITLNAVAWGIFHVEGNGKGNPKYFGTFVGTNPYVSGGRTSSELPANGATPRAIRLIS